MYPCTLLPKERRTLKKLRGRTCVPENEIYHCAELLKYHLIEQNFSPDQDCYGNFISDSTYKLSDGYWRYLEETKWFTTEFVFTHIIIPIALAFLTTILTLLTTGLI